MKRDPEEITGGESRLDGRDILERLEFLEEKYAELKQAVDDAAEAVEEDGEDEGARDALEAARADLSEWDGGAHLDADEPGEPDPEYREMAALREFVDDVGESYCRDGSVQLVAEEAFEDYARELAEDIGETHREDRWPHTCIDWAQAADELRQDYSLFTLMGSDFLCHSF